MIKDTDKLPLRTIIQTYFREGEISYRPRKKDYRAKCISDGEVPRLIVTSAFETYTSLRVHGWFLTKRKNGDYEYNFYFK